MFIIEAARKEHVLGMAKDFMASLEVAMTRILDKVSSQSGFMANVVELLDAQGNATFAPTEHLVNTGGDMDIDTLSVLTKTIDANGRAYSLLHLLQMRLDLSILNMKAIKRNHRCRRRISKLIEYSNKQVG
jgi:hypothetical protein